MAAAVSARTDEEIQRAVLEELKWDARVQPNEIGVAVTDGVVTLTGWVDNLTKKWAAEEAAHHVRGVKAVANDIEVHPPSFAERTDEIASAAVRALQWDALAPSDTIRVTASHGWVTLEGEVRRQFEEEEAERVVRRLAGVKGVDNLIAVRSGVMPSPEELKRKIEDALVRNAELDAQRTQAKVQDSKLILSGTVRSWVEQAEAERVAWSAPGVAEVINYLTINT